MVYRIFDFFHSFYKKVKVQFYENHLSECKFPENIWNKWNIDPGGQVQQYPAAEHFHAHPSEEEHDLCKKDQIDKIDVLVLDSHIDNALGQERENQLQKTAYQQSDGQLCYQVFIIEEVFEQKT